MKKETLLELRVTLNNILCLCQREIAEIRNSYDCDDEPKEQALARDTGLLLEELIYFVRGDRSLPAMSKNIGNYGSYPKEYDR